MNRIPFTLCFLCLGACPNIQPNTFVVSQLQLQGLGFDFDRDGELDNQLPKWIDRWNFFGFDLQEKINSIVSSGEFLVAFDLYDLRGASDLMFGYRASAAGVPRFDSSDAIAPTAGLFQFDNVQLIKGSGPPLDRTQRLSATAVRFEWVLIPFDLGELIILPLENVHLQATLGEDSRMLGSIAGTIRAIEIAKIMEQIPAAFDALQFSEAIEFNNGNEPIPCDGSSTVCGQGGFCPDQVLDGVFTGFCVSDDSTTELAMILDEDGDGHFIVDFDESTQLFVRNELSVLFDLQPRQPPGGVFGEMFDLDMNGDGIVESLSVAVGFDGVSALRVQ